MVHKLALAALGALIVTGAEAEEWRSYANPRFGVFCEYPAMFTRRDDPPVNGDGQGFKTADGRAHLIIFGSYNIDHAASAQLMAERKDAGTSYSYEKATKDWFALSGTYGGTITYVRCNLGAGDVVGCAHIEYPASDARKWSAVVGRISKSLRVRS